MDERERRLRRRFGPPVPVAPPAPARRGVPRRLAAGAVAAAVLAAGAALLLVLTPHDHAAPGCWWWTARTVGQVAAGDRGCVRGVYLRGGTVGEGQGTLDVALPLAYTDPDRQGGRPACAFSPGDAIVLRYHAVFDDGRTIIVVEDCR